MLLFLSILGSLLSVILLLFSSRKNITTAYLGAFFFLLSLYGLYQYALVYSKSPPLIAVFLISFAVITPPLYLIGPVLFWYVRSLLRDDWRLGKNDFWHLLPATIFFIAALPYSHVPASHKVEMAEAVVRDLGIIQVYKTTILADIFSIEAIFLSRPALVLIYAVGSAIIYARYLKQGKLSTVFSGQYFMRTWVFLLIGLVTIMTSTHILLIAKMFAMDFSEVFFTLTFLRLFCWSALIVLLVSPFFFPSVLYGLPRVPEPTGKTRQRRPKPPAPAHSAATGRHRAPATAGNTVSANHFEKEYLQGIGQEVESCMQEQKPYLDPDFNLVWLSAHVRIPLHHLGYYFREVKQQPFTDYRNHWRVKYAKGLIREGKANLLTLEAIGKMSGFSSRNTFRATFEKFEGICPSAYSGQIKE
jgi:AraC-like DNA-binding protein